MREQIGRVFKLDILYQERDGVHMLKSEEVPGLLVANRDFETALRDLGPSVEMCFKLNHGLDVEFLGAVEDIADSEWTQPAGMGGAPPAWLADAVHEVVVRRR